MLNTTLKAGFSGTFGKFPSAYGNVVLYDCHYIFDNILDWFEYENDKMHPTHDWDWINRNAIIKLVRLELHQKSITLCNYTIELDGVLADKTKYYLTSETQMKQSINSQGALIADTVSRSSNYTLVTPLMLGFKSLEVDQAFLNSLLITIILFLGILSVTLLYSLMLADVDSKTY